MCHMAFTKKKKKQTIINIDIYSSTKLPWLCATPRRRRHLCFTRLCEPWKMISEYPFRKAAVAGTPSNYFYNAETAECLPKNMLGLGCLPWLDATPTSLTDLKDCIQRCAIRQPDRTCNVMWNVRGCEKDDVDPVFYFNTTTKRCQYSVPKGHRRYSYSVIRGVFRTLGECEKMCPDGKHLADVVDICYEQLELRDVYPNERRRSAFYDPVTKRCLSFDAANLCLGGDNQFDSLEDCSSTCLSRARDDVLRG
ncbi:tissue factor pathway inhibitor-like isoform X2 [Ornithodoros turicata]|uniref:tissue factor pathway inhibitor-like isoform X2 n=1 Tax=Ornithodoros turicata TaxID=34597 RepID=UPI00313A4200